MKFTAEVKKVQSRKTASLDVEYQITLVTHDPKVLELGAIQGDETVEVSIE